MELKTLGSSHFLTTSMLAFSKGTGLVASSLTLNVVQTKTIIVVSCQMFSVRQKCQFPEQIPDNRSETLPLDCVPNFNPSEKPHCCEQLTAGREKEVTHVEAFPISHELDSPCHVSSATMSEFDCTVSCHDGNRIVKRRDGDLRHRLSFLTDEDVLHSRTISVDVPKADLVIRVVHSMTLNAWGLLPIRRNPQKIKCSLTITS
jgi:hypothetical protein